MYAILVWFSALMAILLSTAGCSSAEVRYDAAPAPIDSNYYTMLLEATCPDGFVGFGQAGCSFESSESPSGSVFVHTPLPGSISVYSRACGIDFTEYLPEQGGIFSYAIEDLFTEGVNFCIVDFTAEWQLPPKMTSEHKLHGMRGRLYLNRLSDGSKKLQLDWNPRPTSTLPPTKGIAFSQLRSDFTTVDGEPIFLILKPSAAIKSGKLGLFGCGKDVERPISGEVIKIPVDEFANRPNVKSSCSAFGYLVGVAEDGSEVDDEFAIGLEFFAANVMKLGAYAEIQDARRLCYNVDDSVSVAGILQDEQVKASNKLNDCFPYTPGETARIGFFTHKGRAAYAIVQSDQIAWLQ